MAHSPQSPQSPPPYFNPNDDLDQLVNFPTQYDVKDTINRREEFECWKNFDMSKLPLAKFEDIAIDVLTQQNSVNKLRFVMTSIRIPNKKFYGNFSYNDEIIAFNTYLIIKDNQTDYSKEIADKFSSVNIPLSFLLKYAINYNGFSNVVKFYKLPERCTSQPVPSLEQLAYAALTPAQYARIRDPKQEIYMPTRKLTINGGKHRHKRNKRRTHRKRR